MHLTKRELNLIIKKFLKENLEPAGAGNWARQKIGRAYLSTSRDLPFLVKGGEESSYNRLKSEAKDLIYLISALYPILVKYSMSMSDLKGSSPSIFELTNTASIFEKTRDIFIVSSGERDGLAQAKAIQSQLKKGNSKEKIINLYSPGNEFDDPFMTQETKANIEHAIDMIIAGEIEKAGNFLDKNIISSHFNGMGFDFRGSEGRAEKVMEACNVLLDRGYANFHFQEEMKGTNNHHIHIGPNSPDQKEYLTEKGKEELKVIQDRLVLVGKTKDIGDAESEDDIPFEQMP